MKKCYNCNSLNWQYEFDDGWVKATCHCGNKIRFETRRSKKAKTGEIGGKAWGIWEMIDGKTFLSNSAGLNHVEVELNTLHGAKFKKIV